MSVLEKLRKLDEERAHLLAGAKAEALEEGGKGCCGAERLGLSL